MHPSRPPEGQPCLRRLRPWHRDVPPVVGALVACVLFSWVSLPSPSFAQTLLGEQQQRAARESLVGDWTAAVGTGSVELSIGGDGQFSLDGTSGEWSVEDDTLRLQSKDAEVSYQFTVDKDQLTLSGGDLAQAMTFSRKPEAIGFLRSVTHLSPEDVRTKLYRLLVIAVILLVAAAVVKVLRLMSRFVIASDWGPLRFVHKYHKKRALTLHSLVLNLVKYVIYFVALGLVLAELGIDYRVYVASLSVIGLAVGFGSQGLVQDVVTGFFVIFEGQFDVGDMVEISGQTGIVQELGLRMTKLRNYLGQVVIIPNRNIAVVGNYTSGALQVEVDVAAGARDKAEEEVSKVHEISKQIFTQFAGVILKEPDVPKVLSLDTGEHFIRVKLAIWPQQQWVVEQQLIPRVREILKGAGFEVPGDRVVATYYAREEHSPRRRRTPTGKKS
jgi:small-conductance mechanosensitive channel